jgi:hypothetical protein
MNRLIRRSASAFAAAAIALMGQPALLASVISGPRSTAENLPPVRVSGRVASRPLVLPKGVQASAASITTNPLELKALLEDLRQKFTEKALEKPRLRQKMLRGIARIDRALKFVQILATTSAEERHLLIRQLPAAGLFTPHAPARAASLRKQHPAEQPDGSQPESRIGVRDLCEDEEGWDECATEQEIEDLQILAVEMDSEQGAAESDLSGAQNDMDNYCYMYPWECGTPSGEEEELQSGPSAASCDTPAYQSPLLQCAAAIGTAALTVGTGVTKVASLWDLAFTAANLTARAVAAASLSTVAVVVIVVVVVAAAVDYCGNLPPPIEPLQFREQ